MRAASGDQRDEKSLRILLVEADHILFSDFVIARAVS
jgi:hypothetical protein